MADTLQTNTAPMNATRIRAAKARRRWIINILIGLVVIFLIGMFIASRMKKPAATSGLVTGVVERRTLTEVVSATGSVTAQTGAMVKIGSQITGRIKKLYADVGDKMQAGDTIAVLDLPDLEAQVRQAQANVSAARVRLAQQQSGVGLQNQQVRSDILKSRAALSVARSNRRQVEQSVRAQIATAQASIRQAEANQHNSALFLSRQEQLYAKGYIAASDVDNARAQAAVNDAQVASARENLNLVQTKVQADLQNAKDQEQQALATLAASQAGTAQDVIKQQQVAEAKAALAQAEASLAFQHAQQAKSLIKTPISGTVIQLAQQQGETIAAGLSAPTLIIVADLERLQVNAYVDETDIGKVRLGQPATVTVDAYPERPFHGQVVKIASGSTTQQNVVTYDVTIALENPEQLLKPDMTATANITVAERANVLAVPIDAVKPSKQGSTVTVQEQGRNGKATYKIIPVRTGISDGEYTEILSGPKEGQVVVLAGEVPGMTTETGVPRFGGPMGFGGPRRGGRGGGGRGR